jgi:hypothetical protein
MPLPLGTYTIDANGSIGQLVIGSSAAGTFNGVVLGQPCTGFFDEAEQEFHFIRVTSPDLSKFEVYQGTLFSFSPNVSTMIQTLAGEFRVYPTNGPVTPFLWSAQLSQKLKEKEGKDGKDKEQSKDNKDGKDNKDRKDNKEGLKEKEHIKDLELSQGQSEDLPSTLGQLMTRLAALEQQIAVGRSFVSPAERPDVGAKATGEGTKKT